MSDRHITSRRAVLALGAALPFAALPGAARAFLAEPVNPHWLVHSERATERVDHAPLAAFLARYRTIGPGGIALVRYGAVTPDDRAALRDYLAGLAAAPVSTLSRPEQFAFWVNLYNGLTIELILAHYPVASIRDIGGGLFTIGPWRDDVTVVEGRTLSLDAIEHGILRPVWRDPRIHYAVNCASLGCPDLADVPWSATPEAMLDRAAAAYVNHPRGVAFDSRGGLVVSSIYRWFREDFGDSAAGVLDHLRRHAAPALAARLDAVERIADHAYDWRLNDGTGLP
ncbi:MAG: DUF547 domain-containing protein [Proteobacteria bacterium]|nr:DUF547 domain-containing protein [Pseudomonadota bacterium]